MWKIKTFILFLLTSSTIYGKGIDLRTASFEEIIKYYTFIGDFKVKPSTRPVKGFFWRYPLIIPPKEFHIYTDMGREHHELASSTGTGRIYEHINRGRVYFSKGQYEEARTSWLSARARFGKTYDKHRRTDYFLALSFLNKAHENLLKGLDFEDPNIRGDLANAATFLNWAFIRKREHKDEFLESLVPKGLYTLATIYYKYQRYAIAYTTALEGLNHLRRTGLKTFRPEFHRLLREGYIINGSHLMAAQEIDSSIRQDPTLPNAAESFTRMGDLYFDLNNFELAEEMYAIGTHLYRKFETFDPISNGLRAEALFWTNNFNDALHAIQLTIDSQNELKLARKTRDIFLSYLYLRKADTHLALANINSAEKRKKQLHKANLAYFQAIRNFPRSEAASIAKVRMACLQLPTFLGNNIKHARKTLQDLRKKYLPLKALELAWSCEVNSYAKALTPDLLKRIKAFAEEFPESKFLAQFIKPIKQLRVKDLSNLLKNRSYYKAISLYENYKDRFFEKTPLAVKDRLFFAYVETLQFEKAEQFYRKDLNQTKEQDQILILLYKSKKNLLQKSEIQELYGKKWKTSKTKLRGYFQNLLRGKGSQQHLGWITQFEYQSHKGREELCQHVLPLLSKWSNQNIQYEQRQKLIEGIFKAYFPELLTEAQDCADNLMSIEEVHLYKNLQTYSKLWQNRLEWPLIGQVPHHLWQAAEILAEQDKEEKAKILWNHLVTKAPDGTLEKRYARLKLNPVKTELNQFWE